MPIWGKPLSFLSKLRSRQGVSLVELLIAIFIVSVGVAAAIGTFRLTSVSTQLSRHVAIANRLAEEKIGQLKEFSYFQLMVSTSATFDTRFTPNLVYDAGSYYGLQSLYENGVTYQRAVKVDFAYRNGTTVTTATWTTEDTGVKLLTVYVMWQERGKWRYQMVQNLISNPIYNPMNATFRGTVTSSLGNPLPGAEIRVIENESWFTYAGAGGNYSFGVSPGTYTLRCSLNGYFTKTTTAYLQINSAQTIVQDFSLVPMSTGTITSYIYEFNNLVISQVVTSTDSAGGTEYVELYNPTTKPINVSGNMRLAYYDLTNSSTTINLVYVSTFVAPRQYYLIANAPTVNAGGVSLNADAVYADAMYQAPSHLMSSTDAGGIRLSLQSTNATVDAVGWNGLAVAPASAKEGTALTLSVTALAVGAQIARMTEPGTFNPLFGNAYDSGNNSKNFLEFNPLTQAPHNRTSGPFAPLAGIPAVNAMIYVNDTLSPTTRAISTITPSGFPTASYTIPNVSTGTWSLFAYHSGNFTQIDDIGITPNVSTGVPNASTTPTWAVANTTTTLLTGTTSYAILVGTVFDGFGNPVPGLKMNFLGRTTFTASDGTYFLAVPAGTGALYANWNYTNPAYTLGVRNLSVSGGIVYDPIDVNIYLGGTLQGFIQTTDGTPLAGRAIVALFGGGNQYSQAVSDSYGYFYLRNITTGTYTINPALDTAETSIPPNMTGVLSSTGAATSITTFTVVNALGKITGQVFDSSSPIRSGVLLVATTSTIAGMPPAIAGSSSALCNPCYYSDLSDGSAKYTLSVRSSTAPYNVYAWYGKYGGSATGMVLKSAGPFALTVSSGATIIQDVSW